MAYIGAEPVPGQNREVDDISSGFNGNATAFTLQVNSVNVSPESAKNILVNLGGVLQNPDTDYTINASTLTFTTAPASGLSFFGLILGAGINTATVADGAITTAKLASDAVGANQLANTSVTAGSYTTADITVDAQGRITAAASGTISGAEIADQAVTNAKVNNSAAIAGSKISPDFGSQNIVTTGSISGASGTFTGDLTIPDTIVHTGDSNTKIRFPGNDAISFETGGGEKVRFNNAGVLFGTNTQRAGFFNTGSQFSPHFQIEGAGDSDDAGRTNSIIYNSTTNAGPVLIFGKTMGSSVGSTTAVTNGAQLGMISFQGLIGSEFTMGASITAQVNGSVGDNDLPTDLQFGTTSDGGSSADEKMRLTAAGNLGIGTSSPDTKLHVVGTAVQFQNTQRTYIQINTSDTHFYTGGSHPLRFGTNSTERMRIDSSGVVQMAVGSSALFSRNTGGTNTTAVLFKTAGSQVGKIFFNNSDTFYSTGSSDRTVKKNFENWTESVLPLFKNLTPQKFHFIQEEDSETKHKGFIAQDEVASFPEAYPKDPDTDKYLYSPNNMVVYLMKAIQELEAKVAALEAA